MSATYREQLRVPLRWWVQATMFLASVWLAFAVAMPGWLAGAAIGVLVAITVGMFLMIGSARVEVRDGLLVAGPARIELQYVGEVTPLGREATRRLHGVDADARAFMMMRPYCKRSVKVTVTDPADPTPYWLVSTGHPKQLAAALAEAGVTVTAPLSE